ncbi:glycerophosphodiester phosphodiesterase [Denitrificimonas caeni]|uniref:Glycerophosphodiester phosphodiesterase family protein n=1 Tax=Denitrificimonas caeni TaxID=521720 RepID=A0AAE9VX46_9GAMM|nr:glycerophosphodiester phosphodiesterase family protein [Denitrificimonas caeni]WBE26401.1 glycerophosphodiester phosphodiesterase family protein [Denitrificimonas caeni]
MTLIYGHRGARGEAPENTLVSFQACLAAGVTRCELDLHLSKDLQLIVIHDASLKRTTGRRGKVSQYTAEQLLQMDARHNTAPWPSPCPIPSLEHLFSHCAFVHWQLEVKESSKKRAAQAIQAIVELSARFAMQDKIIITSSSRTVLRAAQAGAPHLARGLVAEYAWLNPIKIALRYQCQMLVLNWELATKQRIKQAQKAGLNVSVWTVNEPALMRRLVTYGADSLITDFPGLATATLGSL